MLGLSFPRGAAPQYSELLPGPYGARRGRACWAGPRRFLLLAGQPVKLPAQLVRVVALGGKPGNFLEPLPELFDLHGKPGGLLRLLYQQFRDVRRVHVHLPFLDALRRFAGPGPCGLGLSRMLADGRAAVKPPKTFPPAPLKGGVGNFFCTKFAGCFWAI